MLRPVPLYGVGFMGRNLTLSLLLFCGICPLPAQQFLNGSFENSDADCHPRMPHSGFTSHVRDVSAFGWTNWVDLLTSDCGAGPAQDGDYFIGLYIEGDYLKPSVIGLKLSQPLVPGNSYTVRFHHRAGDRFSDLNILEFGVSDSSRLFGELVYAMKGTPDDWTPHEFQFVASAPAIYLNMRLRIGIPTKWYLDNFSIECPTELHLGNDTILCRVDAFTLVPQGRFDRYIWQDGSGADSLTVHAPGAYWLEAQRGQCILSDTVRVEEYEFNCECPIYLPNAFSPNGDGINDLFRPVSPCEMIHYEFTVLNRWGRPVFFTADPGAGWGAESIPAYAQEGPYQYVLPYRFRYDEKTRYQRGGITLIR